MRRGSVARDEYGINDALLMVERVERETMGRRTRMDDDYKLARGDAYDTNVDADGNEAGTEFRSFTTNEAGAFMRKIVAILAGAQLLIHVPYGKAQKEQRAKHNLKELFAKGGLTQSDDLLEMMVEPSLLRQLSWFAPNRGWLTTRALLVNTEDGQTLATARPWDPRNVYWEVARGGLLWVVHKNTRTASQVLNDYPRASLSVDEGDAPVVVYDMYSVTKNAVFTADGFLKRWQRHGSPRLPVIITPVPTQPPIWAPTSLTNEQGMPDTVDDYGESIFATNRALYNSMNEAMSITLELLSRAREPSSVVFSDEEDTELKEDPNRRGGVHYLGLENKFQQVPPPETTKDAVQFLQMLTGMLQRGALPYSAYGELSFAISGYAITQLNQQMLTVIGPQADAVARNVRGVLDLWTDQFQSGAFNPMTVRGMGRNKDYLQETIMPGQIANLPPFTVELVPQLPQDDISRLQAASAARAGDRPFLPDRWLLDNFLKVPDADTILQELKVQTAENAAPGALAITLAKAAIEEGNLELARVYLDENQKAMVISMMGIMQAMQQGMPQGGTGGGSQGQQRGLPPTVLPASIASGERAAVPAAPTGEEGRFGLPRNVQQGIGGEG